MSGMGRCADKRIERNVAYLLRCPESTVPEAMQACKYSTNKNVNTTKQMAVGCTHKKAIDAKKKATPPNVIDASKVGTSTMSPLTTALTSGDSAKVRYLGVYLYPCMPNTTAVKQETD